MKKLQFFGLLACVLVAGISLGCGSYPMKGQFGSNDIPLVEQSVLCATREMGVNVEKIDGIPIPPPSLAEYYVLTPGKHEITVSYIREKSDYVFRVLALGRDTYTEMTITSEDSFTIDFNFLPGRYYEIVGGDSFQFSLPASTIAFVIVDFTTKDLSIAWPPIDLKVAMEIAKAKSSVDYDLQRILIERSKKQNNVQF